MARDENLADLETDKVVLEVPAPVAGVLKEIKVQAGATVTSGQLLAVIEAGAWPPRRRHAGGTPRRLRRRSTPLPRQSCAAAPAAVEVRAGGDAASAAETGVDIAAISGSGAGGGASTKADVRGAGAAARRRCTAGGRVERRVPMTRLRARIAERLVEAQATQALLTTFNEVDLMAVQELRARYKDKFEKQHGVKLGFMSFFVKAVIEALKRFPVGQRRRSTATTSSITSTTTSAWRSPPTAAWWCRCCAMRTS